MAKPNPPKSGDIATNRQAFFKFSIEEKLICGIQLQGTEVKSIRAGNIQLADAFIDFFEGEAFLTNAHIPQYDNSGYATHDPARRRKLLLKKSEIEYLAGASQREGRTVVVLRVFMAGRWVKLEVGLAKGKKQHDQRQSIKEREAKREIERSLRSRR